MTFPPNNNVNSNAKVNGSSLSLNSRVQKKFKDNIFDFIFSDNQKKLIDENNDGTIQLSEIKKSLNGQASFSIVDKLGSIFNINHADYDKRKKAVEYFLNWELQQRYDCYGNNDDILSLDEIKKSEDFKNYNLGIIDGSMSRNKQGEIGDCWLLSEVYNIMVSNPEKYRQIVKQDLNSGDIIVTFFGAKDSNGNPFQYRIKYSDILNKDVSDIASNDPDAIAIETAMQAYMDSENRKVADKRRLMIEYLKTAEFYKKPTADALKYDLENEGRTYSGSYSNILLYLEYSKPMNNEAKKIRKELLLAFSENTCTKDQIEKYEKYLLESDWDLSSINTNKKYHSFETAEKLWPLLFFSRNESGLTGRESLHAIVGLEDVYSVFNFKTPYLQGIDGGKQHGFATNIILGGDEGHFIGLHDKKEAYYDEYGELPEEKIKLLDKEVKQELKALLHQIKEFGISGNICQVSFKKTDKYVSGRHANTILAVNKNHVVLADPHGKTINYPIKDFMKNFVRAYVKEI